LHSIFGQKNPVVGHSRNLLAKISFYQRIHSRHGWLVWRKNKQFKVFSRKEKEQVQKADAGRAF